MKYKINLRLDGGKVIPSTNSLIVNPGDTLEFSSEQGEVNVTFDPADAVGNHIKIVTVGRAPFKFGCALKTPDGKVVGWPDQPDAGGNGEPPH